MRHILCTCVILLLPSTCLAGNESRYTARPLPGDRFEVIGRFSENSIYWCGAGHFAQTRLGRSASTRLYVLQGPSSSQTLPGKTAVTFGFSAANTDTNSKKATGVGGGFAIDPVPGMSLSVAQALQYCTDRSASDS